MRQNHPLHPLYSRFLQHSRAFIERRTCRHEVIHEVDAEGRRVRARARKKLVQYFIDPSPSPNPSPHAKRPPHRSKPLPSLPSRLKPRGTSAGKERNEGKSGFSGKRFRKNLRLIETAPEATREVERDRRNAGVTSKRRGFRKSLEKHLLQCFSK